MPPLSTSLSRPRGLLLTSVLCILVGWGGVWSGYREVSFYSADTLDEPPVATTMEAREQEAIKTYYRADAQARDHARPVRLPLAIGNMLLSGLLVLASSRAFGGRPGARSLAMQAVGANAVLAVADYVLSRDMRAEQVPAVASFLRVMSKPAAAMSEADVMAGLTSGVWTAFRLHLLLVLALYAASWLTLSSDAARAYLIETRDDEDDE